MSLPCVLLVDDSPTSRAINRVVLAGLNVEMLEVFDGAAALRLLYERHVDVIVTDNRMPVLSGLQLCQIVRASAVHKHIKLIMVTGDEDANLVRSAMQAGVDKVVSKQNAGVGIRSIVEELLQTQDPPSLDKARRIAGETAAKTFLHASSDC